MKGPVVYDSLDRGRPGDTPALDTPGRTTYRDRIRNIKTYHHPPPTPGSNSGPQEKRKCLTRPCPVSKSLGGMTSFYHVEMIEGVKQ